MSEQPTFPLIRRIDEAWSRAERLLAAGMFLMMGLLVLAQVLTQQLGARGDWTHVVGLFGVVLLGVRTRSVKEGEQRPSWPFSLGIAALITLAVSGAVWGYLELTPTGLPWGQKVAMVLLIWVAMLGASIATYERSHLALEMGEKLWPAKIIHLVKAFAHGVTSAFCVMFTIVAVQMVLDYRDRDVKVAEAVTAAEPIPLIGDLQLWVIWLVLPYALTMMAVRFLAQAVTTATGTASPLEERLPS